MVKIKAYSKNNLNNFLNLLSKKIFIYFYDLNLKYFENVISKLKSCFNVKEIVKLNNEYLILFGILDVKDINSLIEELAMLDIGEFEIAEYFEEKTIIEQLENSKYSPPLILKKSNFKSIYVNKDERIIQFLSN